jgi:hypothetical protein
MNAAAGYQRLAALLISSALLVTVSAMAQEPQAEEFANGSRWEVWLALSGWSGLADIEPVAGGSFDAAGYGIGAAAHWPVKTFNGSELLLGIEGAVMAHDSNVPVYLDDFLARDAYVGVSAKWLLGDARNVSLDAGLAYHLLDMAQLDTNYYGAEFQNWEESAAGIFVGGTWDVGAGKPGNSSGVSLGLRAHFVEFGTVRDRDSFIRPVLGDDAGAISDPLVVVQIGYRSR